MFYELTEAEAETVRALARNGTCEDAAAELGKPANELRRELSELRDRLLRDRDARAA